MSILDAFHFIGRRRTAYVKTFTSTAFGDEVLRDLAVFCRANQTCFNPDPRIHAVAEGRREVWLRIQNHLNLTEEQLFALTAPQNIQRPNPQHSQEE